MQINPAVSAAAELFTDGRITDQLLADVAAMHRLPLHIATVADPGPTDLDLAFSAVSGAVAFVARARRDYIAARRRLAYANKRQPHLTAEARASAGKFHRASAMRDLNRARAECARAERAEATARAALAALSAPAPFALAA